MPTCNDDLIEQCVETALIDELRYDPSTGVYYVTHDFDGPQELSTTIVGAIAAVTGVDAEEVAPLSTIFDADALDALFRRRDAEDGVARLTFVHDGRRVTVYATGDVVIRP